MSRPTRFTPEMIDAYVKSGYWTRETTLDVLAHHIQAQPDKIAIVDPKQRLTWKEVGETVDRFAHVLHDLGLERDTPVVVQMPNSVEDCLIRFALKKVGLLGAYIPVVWGHRELRAVIDMLEPGMLIVPEYFRDNNMLTIARKMEDLCPNLQVIVCGVGKGSGDYIRLSSAGSSSQGTSVLPIADSKAFDPFEVSKLVVTSGSTGVPKIVERPEQQELLWGKGLAGCLELVSGDTIGGFVPFSGGPGYFAWASWLVSGCKLVLSDGFSPKTVLSLVEHEQVTVVMTAPAVLARIIDSSLVEQYDVSSLRAVRTGAANLPRSVAQKTEDLLSCIVLKAGGSMETGNFGQVSTKDPETVRLGPSIGKVMAGAELCVVDANGNQVSAGSAGELWARGPGTSSGYFRDSKTTKEAWGSLGPEGWFRTGDVATIDTDGNVTLVGRVKEMINRGGMNIFPIELESILAEHPKILEATIVAIPDNILGEVPCLCAITRDGTELSLEDVTEFLERRKLAHYKFPARLILMKEFPRGQTMRVNRRKLAAIALGNEHG